MKKMVKVSACQTPEIIGDPIAALGYLLLFAKEAEREGVDLLLFPECFLSGYIVTEDYLNKYAFDFESQEFAEILERLKAIKPMLVFGVSEKKDGAYYNSAAVVEGGKIVGVYRKTHLVAGEKIFTAGNNYPVFEIKGLRFGINICYDTQFVEAAKAIADQGAVLLLSPAQNMMRLESAEKWRDEHAKICKKRVDETKMWLIRSDVTGIRPKDEEGIERIAYGPTLVMDPNGKIVDRAPLMTTGMVAAEIPIGG